MRILFGLYFFLGFGRDVDRVICEGWVGVRFNKVSIIEKYEFNVFRDLDFLREF